MSMRAGSCVCGEMCGEMRDTTNGEWAKVRKNDLEPARPAREDECARNGRDQVARRPAEVLVGRSQEKRPFIIRRHCVVFTYMTLT